MLVDEPRGVRVTDIANRLRVNRAIPHRLLAELVDLGYVVQDERTDRYLATFQLGSLGLRQLEMAGVLGWAQNEIDRLAATTSELVRLAVTSGDTLRFIAKAQGANSQLIVDAAVHSEVVLHATASGKAWLSTLPRGEVESILAAHGLAPQTPHTDVDMARLLSEIDGASQVGFALTHEEMEPGINAIAMPIIPLDVPEGRAVGTVSIAGPSARLTTSVLINFTPVLRATAELLARQWHVYEYLYALTHSTGTVYRSRDRDATAEIPAAG